MSDDIIEDEVEEAPAEPQPRVEGPGGFAVEDIVEIVDRVGFYWVTKLPSESDEDVYTLYGGKVTKRGGPRVLTVSAHTVELKRIVNKYTMARAVAARRVVADVMAESPRPHHKKAGKK